MNCLADANAQLKYQKALSKHKLFLFHMKFNLGSPFFDINIIGKFLFSPMNSTSSSWLGFNQIIQVLTRKKMLKVKLQVKLFNVHCSDRQMAVLS